MRGGDIGITRCRSPVYAWHDPRQLDEDGVYEYMDQGLQRSRYRLVPHAGDWRDAGVVRRAAELNQPPFALLESFHDGALPQRASFADDGGGDVVVTVLKGAEDGDALVVRAYETAGRAGHATTRAPRPRDRGRLRRRTRSRRSSCRATRRAGAETNLLER